MSSETGSVSKIHELFDEAQNCWFDVYEAPGLQGQTIRVEVPRGDRSTAVVERALLHQGAILPPQAERRAALAEVIQRSAPVVHRVARTGWQNNHTVFVSHREVVGAARGIALLPPKIAGAAANLQIRGTLEGWRELVGAAQHSTAMTVAACAPFAAPLLSLVRRPNFACVLVGPSRSGKSTAQLVAASAMGFGLEKDLPSLNSTDAGLLSTAIAFNDHLLPINEIGTARGSKRDIYVGLRNDTYALINGQDVLRHPSWGGVGSVQGTFNVLVLLSSEHSPDTWAARNGETRDEGEIARLIGLPAVREGDTTIFDRPPRGLAGEDLAAWEVGQRRRLRQGLPNQCGTALPHFMAWLVRDRRKLRRRARKIVERFEKRMITPEMSPVARDIVAKFGILKAGGQLAIEAGVLPLDRKVLHRAVKRACRAALSIIPDPNAELRADIALLRQHLAGASVIDGDDYSPKRPTVLRSADGFHRPRNRGREYAVRGKTFLAWFGNPSRARRLLESLQVEGLLVSGREPEAKRSLERAQTQVTWPDDTRVRSILIYLPAGLPSLEYAG